MRYMFGRAALLAAVVLLGVATPGFAADKVVVGMIGSLSDAPFFLATDNGYFKDEGIDPQFEVYPIVGESNSATQRRSARCRFRRNFSRRL